MSNTLGNGSSRDYMVMWVIFLNILLCLNGYLLLK